MAKIYYRKYLSRIESGEITLEEALALIDYEVPRKWHDAVKELLLQLEV